jgi:hypothetical protein
MTDLGYLVNPFTCFVVYSRLLPLNILILDFEVV